VSADAANSSGASTGNAGSINIRAFNSTANVNGLISASSVLGQAGTVNIAANDINATANIKANGTTGGSINMTATNGNTNLNNSIISANGSSNNGGYIQIAAQNNNQFS
jgi:hypothetical protein